MLAYAAARLAGSRLGGYARGRQLRQLDHLALGRDRSLVLVEVAGQVMVLGVTGGQISLITTVTDPEIAQALLAEQDLAASPGSSPLTPLAAQLLTGLRPLAGKLRQGVHRLRGKDFASPPVAPTFQGVLDGVMQPEVPVKAAEPLAPGSAAKAGDPAVERLTEALKRLKQIGQGEGSEHG